ncbi:hypothetical protein [Polyangium spumosum]|uniref:Integral membrane protein n=1 Tax=Polyangium spumosum TaxID=889282 RepID=A0A6N7PY39_9BACT|nr:hypothetical protein [Polyangium spumosum]MRG97102.1 hypothetical protein [Polyangium spumosum]
MGRVPRRGARAASLVALVVLSAVAAPGQTRAAEPAPPSAEERGGWDGRFVVGMSALGVSALSLGFGILSTYHVRRVSQEMRSSAFTALFPNDDDVCAASDFLTGPGASHMRETCARGNRYNVLQYAMYGLHVGSAIAGIVLLAKSGGAGEKKGAAWVTPVVSAGYGGVVVAGRF